MLAEMEAWNFRSGLAEAQAKYDATTLEMNRSLARNESTEAGVRQVQAAYWKAEVERARELLEKAQLRSPIDGVVATPHVEDFAGRKLEKGDSFAEIVDTSEAIVDIAVEQGKLHRPEVDFGQIDRSGCRVPSSCPQRRAAPRGIS